jgi:SAM-dependent methyltransferase
LCQIQCRPYTSIPTDSLSEAFFNEDWRKELPYLILDKCPNCASLWCADRRRDECILLKTYELLPDTYFEDIMESPESDGSLYDLLERRLYQFSPGLRVCDLGCGDGNFLSHLSNRWERFGIEPSKRAADIACQRGLNVQSGTLDTCLEPSKFDSIVAIDVLEHLLNPRGAIESVRSRLRPGGIFVAVTGDAAALTASVAGPQWSYLRWCGHVSILSAMAIRAFLEQAGFTIEVWERCEHPASSGALAWLRVWALEPLRQKLRRPKSWFPYWRDHQLIVARS